MLKQITLGYAFFFGIVFFLSMDVTHAAAFRDIWKHIFEVNDYNKYVRPVNDSNTVTTININLALIAIIDFNEVKQTITLATKVTQSWFDEFMTWNPSDFGDIEHTHVLQNQIWKPYIFLENSVKKQAEFGTPSLHVTLEHDGHVTWNTVEVFETTCTTDVTNFPFDQQTCSLIFESFGYAKSEISVMSASDYIEIHSYGGISGWSVTETDFETVHDEEDDHVIASLTLKRNPIYLVLNVIVPISLLSFLNNCVFLLPVRSGEKAGFVITVFLSLAVFLTIVSEKLPENSDHISLLNVYVFLNSLTSVIIAIITIMQIRLYHRDPKIKVPVCLAKAAIYFNFNRPSKVEAVDKFNRTLVERIVSQTQADSNLNQDTEDDIDTRKDARTEQDLSDVNWRFVVKALDNILLTLFLTANLTMTLAFILAAANAAPESNNSHGGEH